jgi:hypothetical protein
LTWKLLSGIVLKKRPKRILAKYATSERVERAEVAGQATTKQKSRYDRLTIIGEAHHICCFFIISAIVFK